MVLPVMVAVGRYFRNTVWHLWTFFTVWLDLKLCCSSGNLDCHFSVVPFKLLSMKLVSTIMCILMILILFSLHLVIECISPKLFSYPDYSAVV